MIRKIHLVAAATAAVLCAACDTHIDVPDTAVRPGHILCEDGTALPYAQYEQSGKKAIAVVFDTEKRGDTEGDGYAVYLWDIAPQAFYNPQIEMFARFKMKSSFHKTKRII